MENIDNIIDLIVLFIASLVALGLTRFLSGTGTHEVEESGGIELGDVIYAGKYYDAVGNVIEPEHLIDACAGSMTYDEKGNIVDYGVSYCGGACRG